MGISRATYFNWLLRDKAPPSKAHRAKLVEFFGASPSYVLDGIAEKLDSNLDRSLVGEARSDHDGLADLATEVERHHAELLAAANNDPARLGWIREQQQAHLAIPAHWRDPDEVNRRALVRSKKMTAAANLHRISLQHDTRSAGQA